MADIHNIANLIFEKSLDKNKGSRKFVENISTGNLEVYVAWTKRKYKLNIKYRKSNLFEDFPKCIIKRSVFMEFVTRSEFLTMSGKKSKANAFLLSNEIAISILDLKGSKIGVDGKFLTFQMHVNRDDKSFISDLFWSLEVLGEQFDAYLKNNR
ncbi:hypothetical protein [Flavivirga eckloniae]|uniref:Uncharacterized protein n=1 Tax=Flavivirga eckloniae TaxID=1803846 RepID=A0A2K9PLW9_9FLAO|nr:hypothetical protein [Flavivirga eckloniae]AUP78026.1 hypothetical protein C1H87_04580 [Flavivirga eckloniae]